MKKTITILMLFMVTTLTHAQKLTDLNLDSVIFRVSCTFNTGLIKVPLNPKYITHRGLIYSVGKNHIIDDHGCGIGKCGVLFTFLHDNWFNEFKSYSVLGSYKNDIEIYTIDKYGKKTIYDTIEFYHFFEKLDSRQKQTLSDYMNNNNTEPS